MRVTVIMLLLWLLLAASDLLAESHTKVSAGIDASALEPGHHLDKVAVGQGGLKPLEVVLEMPKGAQDLVPVLLEDRRPELRIRAGDPRRVPQPQARIVAPARVARRRGRARPGSYQDPR